MLHHLSLWEQETFYEHQDFVIAGAGLVGLWCALELKSRSPKAKITLIEKSPVPIGASTRNAGFACFGSPTEMLNDAATMGEDKMWQIAEMRYKGIEKIRKTFKDEDIDFDNCGGYECFQNKSQPNNIVGLIEWLNKGMRSITGVDNSFTWCNAKLAQFGFNGFDSMVENRFEGGLHSGKLVRALLQKLQGMGVQVLTGGRLKKFATAGEDILVETDHYNLACKKLLICTNALSAELAPEISVQPGRGQIIVTSPIEGLKISGTFHFDRGYYYFRNVGGRVLIGGARNISFETEETAALEITDIVQAELEDF